MNKLSFQKVAKKKKKGKKTTTTPMSRTFNWGKGDLQEIFKGSFLFNLEVLYIFFFLGQANDNQKTCQH
jgi:hypothetical protein